MLHVGNSKFVTWDKSFSKEQKPNQANTEQAPHTVLLLCICAHTGAQPSREHRKPLPDAGRELLGGFLDAVPRGGLGDAVALLAAAVVVAAVVVALALLALVEHAVAARAVVRARHRLARAPCEDVVRRAVREVDADGRGVVLGGTRVVVLDKDRVLARGAVRARRDAVDAAVDAVHDGRAVRVEAKHRGAEGAVDREDLAQLVRAVARRVGVAVHRRVAVERVRVRPHARVVRGVAVHGRAARGACGARHHVRDLLGQVAAQVLARVRAQAHKARRLQRRVEAHAHLRQVVRDRDRVALDLDARLVRGLARRGRRRGNNRNRARRRLNGDRARRLHGDRARGRRDNGDGARRRLGGGRA